eukprot:scaffold121054_cov18-Tisochrysis_lutea.AAC.2
MGDCMPHCHCNCGAKGLQRVINWRAACYMSIAMVVPRVTCVVRRMPHVWLAACLMSTSMVLHVTCM